MKANGNRTAGVLLIGDEILSGRIQDENAIMIAKWLRVRRIQVAEIRIVPDDRRRIASAANELRSAMDYVFTTGGLGSTHDDVTVESIAAALRTNVIIDPDAQNMLRQFFATRGGMNKAKAKMAQVPQGANLVGNAKNTFPVIRIKNIIILPGVPEFVKVILESGCIEL